MPPWLPATLRRIRALARARQVRFTLKARMEPAALDLGLDEEDACDLMGNLAEADWTARLRSVATGEWLYVFKPVVAGTVLYMKVILRGDCIVVSFHPDGTSGHEQGNEETG